jgi:hypothetical protein
MEAKQLDIAHSATMQLDAKENMLISSAACPLKGACLNTIHACGMAGFPAA